MGLTDQAKSVKGAKPKPPDEKKKASCPCEPFLQCSGRSPYGESVWSDPAERKIACSRIAYDGNSAVSNASDLNDFQAEFARRLAGGPKQNQFYKSVVQKLKNAEKLVLYLPEISESQLNIEILALAAQLHNAEKFTDFQKSMALRANLKKNGLQKLTEDNENGSGTLTQTQLNTYKSGSFKDQWNADHIKTKSRGGCNRFCNIALLAFGKNRKKGAQEIGCPCVNAFKANNAGAEKGERDEFTYSGSGKALKAYKLYECSFFTSDKKSDKPVDYVPAFPLGTMDQYKTLCGLDDPRETGLNRMAIIRKRAYEACGRTDEG